MKNYIIIILIFLLHSTNTWGWWDKSTHRIISENASKLYFEANYLETELALDGGTPQKATLWLQDGSELEDQGQNLLFFDFPVRSLNHFHDPTKPLSESGLTNVPLPLFYGESALLWAQDGDTQKTKLGGDWSWNTVRDHQYNYLTAQTTVNRDANQARMLKGLGYQMHLLQDMSQPNHVRNDTHMADGAGKKTRNGFETWAVDKDRVKEILASAKAQEIINAGVSVNLNTLYEGGKAPVARLYDTRDNRKLDTSVTPNIPYIAPSASLAQGLAEYTNTNFFSEDTVFAAERYSPGSKLYSPYPRKEETDLQDFIDQYMEPGPATAANGTSYLSYRIKKPQSKTTGEELACLALPGPNTLKMYNEFGGDASEMFFASFRYDTACYEEHAKLLLARSVSYSKAMLDYFFRGTLTITAAPTDITFSSIKVTATNTTPNETMGTGEVSLVIRYKALAESGSTPTTVGYPSADYSYKVAKLQNINPSGLLTFNFTDGPLPMNYSDMTMQLVYKGKLGNEEGAVAVSKPEPITGIYSDLELSLPTTGIYAKTAGDSVDATFSEVQIKIRNTTPADLTDGTFQLVMKYRTATDDPFQSHQVATAPTGAYAYIAHYPLKTGVSTLPQGNTSELTFDLSSQPISVKSTQVAMFVVYTSSDGTQRIGYADIPEPTPVDIFNNTDYTCANGQWYPSGSPELFQLKYKNTSTYLREVRDLYPHNITNLAFWVKSPDNTLFTSSTILTPNSVKRLGYILTDSTFTYGFNEKYIHPGPFDTWGEIENPVDTFPGTAVINNSSSYPGMMNIRGKLMWWGSGVVYENNSYLPGWSDAVDDSCSWSALQ
jgi:hypothetical protein